MRFNSNLMMALGCVSLLAMSEPAFSQPKPRDGRAPRLASTAMAYAPKKPTFGWPVLVSEARKYMGTNPTDRTRLWCATFMNMVLAKAGYSGTNSDAAKSFAQYGRRISEPRVGAIAVLTRGKNGGHVGVVSGIDANGNPIVISGNHNKRVGESVYPRSRVIAYVMPSESRTGNTQVAERGVAGKSSDIGFDSPIAELLAAIEAEQSPSRSLQAAPQQGNQTAVRQPAAPSSANARRQVELDPAIAQMFGINQRNPSTPRVAPQPPVQQQVQQQAPQRELRVEQVQSGRVASDAGLASRLLPVSR